MKTSLTIKPHSVHLWRAFVPELLSEIEDFFKLLTPDEQQRATRFHFLIHRQRFIIARAILRLILSQYLTTLAHHHRFSEGKYGKPYIRQSALQFNVSHSHDMVIYGLTLNQDIGVDIEKMEPQFNRSIAERFFSVRENHQLSQLNEQKKPTAFYQLWAAKEAVIKMLGAGLYMPLTEFSVDFTQSTQQLVLNKESMTHCHIETFIAHPDYQAAFATPPPVLEKQFWEWKKNGPRAATREWFNE